MERAGEWSSVQDIPQLMLIIWAFQQYPWEERLNMGLFFPTERTEAYIAEKFAIDVIQLRNGPQYDTERQAYHSGPLGFGDSNVSVITDVNQQENQLVITYWHGTVTVFENPDMLDPDYPPHTYELYIQLLDDGRFQYTGCKQIA